MDVISTHSLIFFSFCSFPFFPFPLLPHIPTSSQIPEASPGGFGYFQLKHTKAMMGKKLTFGRAARKVFSRGKRFCKHFNIFEPFVVYFVPGMVDLFAPSRFRFLRSALVWVSSLQKIETEITQRGQPYRRTRLRQKHTEHKEVPLRTQYHERKGASAHQAVSEGAIYLEELFPLHDACYDRGVNSIKVFHVLA